MGDEETKNLLKSCAENLLNAVSRLENRPQGSSPMAPVTPVAPMVPVVEEHRRLFGYRPPNNCRASSSTNSRNGKQPAPKRRVVATSTGDCISIPVRNTWTRTFVCLEKRKKKKEMGGTVASWLARSTPERALRVRALAGVIVLCSWARHFTLTVPLSTQVYKWVPANLMLGGNPAMD